MTPIRTFSPAFLDQDRAAHALLRRKLRLRITDTYHLTSLLVRAVFARLAPLTSTSDLLECSLGGAGVSTTDKDIAADAGDSSIPAKTPVIVASYRRVRSDS